MDYTDDQLKNIILQVLHRIPDKLSIQKNILSPLKIELDASRLSIIRNQLVKEGLLMEEDSKDSNSLVEITKAGYDAIEFYGNYANYKKQQDKFRRLRQETAYLKARNLRLKNVNMIVGIISFILGILLSDPIKSILKQWMTNGG